MNSAFLVGAALFVIISCFSVTRNSSSSRGGVALPLEAQGSLWKKRHIVWGMCGLGASVLWMFCGLATWQFLGLPRHSDLLAWIVLLPSAALCVVGGLILVVGSFQGIR